MFKAYRGLLFYKQINERYYAAERLFGAYFKAYSNKLIA